MRSIMSYSKILIIFLNYITYINGEYKLTILHTNDVHARFMSFNSRQRPCEPADIESNDCYGGVARRMTALRKYTKEDTNVMTMDAGDQFQGTLWYTALKWQPIADYMNIMKYDVMAFGNHEFDDGIEGVEPFIRNITTPVISSNIEDYGTSIKSLLKKKFIKEVGGQKIGVAATTTTDTPDVSKSGPKLEFTEEIRALQPVVNEMLKSGINKIIVLSHSGIVIDRQICQKVKGVDIVVGGHSHSLLWTGIPPTDDIAEGPYPEAFENHGEKCLVVQAFAYGKYLGRLRVTFDDQGVLRNWSGNNPILLDAASWKEDEEINKILKPYSKQLEHFQKTVAARTAVALDGNRRACRSKECNLGNLLTDATVHVYTQRKLDGARNKSDTGWSAASIGLWNGGGVRDYECLAGENVTLGDLYTIMPFQNTIDKISLKGLYIKQALEHSVADYNPTEYSGKFLQVSGIKVVYDLSKPPGRRVKRLRVRCHRCGVPQYDDIKLDKVYYVVTTTYLSRGGDGYVMLRNNTLSIESPGTLDIDVVLAYMQSYQPLINGEDLRIEFDDGTGRTSSSPFQQQEKQSVATQRRISMITLCAYVTFSIIVIYSSSIG